MLRKIGFALGLLLIGVSTSNAQIGLFPAIVGYSHDGVSLASAYGAGQSYALSMGTNGTPVITWQTTYSAAPSTVTVLLQGSQDNSNWYTIDTSTSTAGEIRTVYGSYKFIRANNSVVTGGAGKTLSTLIAYSLAGGTRVTGASFNSNVTIASPYQLLLPDGSISAPSASFTNEPTMGFFRQSAGYTGFVSVNAVRIIWGATGLIIRNGAGIYWSSDPGSSAPDLFLGRDAANTLALRNSTNAQTFNIYNTYTDGSNNEQGYLSWSGNALVLGMTANGSGTAREVQIKSSAGGGWGVPATGQAHWLPTTSDAKDLGSTSNLVKDLFVSRAVQGAKTKALTESSATTVATVAVPQTAGANYAGGEMIWTVYAADATDSQLLAGRAIFSAVNKAGTESCSLDDNQQTAEVASAGTLACTVACATGLTDVVGITMDCTSSLTQTTLNAQVRFDMPQANTLTFP